MKQLLFVLSISLAAVPRLAAQPAPEVETVMGEIQTDGATDSRSLRVELQGNENRLSFLGEVTMAGSFQLERVPAGTYLLTVRNQNGTALRQQVVAVGHGEPRLTVSLPETQREPHAGGTISLRRLRHKIPAKARRAFHHGQRLAAKARYEEARKEFQEALRADPEFLEARVNLGVQHLRLREFAAAREEFSKAVELEPDSPAALSNLGYTLIQLRRPWEAEGYLRRAVQVEPAGSGPHWLLGWVLTMKRSGATEAERHLRLAAEGQPRALLTLAEFFSRGGRQAESQECLAEYERRHGRQGRLLPDFHADRQALDRRTNSF